MENKLQALNRGFLRLPSAVRTLIIIAVVSTIAVGDILTPSYISFSGYYLIPIFLSIWSFSELKVFTVVFSISLLTKIYVIDSGLPPETPFWQSATSFGSIVFAFVVFSVLIKLLKTYVLVIEENGDKDQLTGLRSRRNFLATAEYELERRKRIRYPVSVVMLDIDCFKLLNDTQGHAAGDRFLATFSQFLQHSLRNVDIVGRVGGDEFAVVLSNITFEHTNVVLSHLHSSLKPVLDSFGCEKLGLALAQLM